MNLRVKEVKFWLRISIKLGVDMGDLRDPEIIKIFWNKDVNSVFKEAIYIVILQTACDVHPWTFYGEDIGLGGKVGFSVHKLKKIANIFRLRFEKNTAFKVYDEFVKQKYVRAIKRKKKLREYTLYSITDKGRKASMQTLDSLQSVNRIQNEFKRQFEKGVISFIARPEEWDRCWQRIGEIWKVEVNEDLLSKVFTQIILQ